MLQCYVDEQRSEDALEIFSRFLWSTILMARSLPLLVQLSNAELTLGLSET